MMRGEIAAGRALYVRAYRLAAAGAFTRALSRIAVSLATCDLADQNYQNALTHLRDAERQAKASGDCEALTLTRMSLANLYLQLFDVPRAAEAAQSASSTRGCLPLAGNRADLDMQLGWIDSLRGRTSEAIRSLKRATVEADIAGDGARVSQAWHRLGAEFAAAQMLDQAEDALSRAYRIRRFSGDPALFVTRFELARVKLARGDVGFAKNLIDSSFASANGRRLPDYLLLALRAAIRKAGGDFSGALGDYRMAIASAGQWRGRLLPSDSFRTKADSGLQRIYDGHIEAAVARYLQTGERDLAVEAWRSAEINRAASLRERLASAEDWHDRLAPEYWETLARIGRLEANGLGHPASHSDPRFRALRATLEDMETKAGLSVDWDKSGEKIKTLNSLVIIQTNLGPSRTLMSFHLGEHSSYRWTVSADRISVDVLPRAATINRLASQFRRAIEAGEPKANRLGAALYRTLFTGVREGSPHTTSEWLLALDGNLFEIPFGALTVNATGQYLVEQRTLEVVPGAWAVGTSSFTLNGGFLGIGDPVYNRADPRYLQLQTASMLPDVSGLTALFQKAQPAAELPRLIGSGYEVELCARQWNSGFRLLTGIEATRARLSEALNENPAAVHIATHFVPSSQSIGQTLIALSLRPIRGRPLLEVLTSGDISTLRIKGSLVVLSGCSSGVGQTLPGAGLLSLGRAFLTAGASSVVATLWPTPDDSGELFASFYRHLARSATSAGLRPSPAEALRAAQLEMLDSSGWRSKPSYWAAYNLTARSSATQ